MSLFEIVLALYPKNWREGGGKAATSFQAIAEASYLKIRPILRS
jgi:hypothetical protein